MVFGASYIIKLTEVGVRVSTYIVDKIFGKV